MMTLSILLLPFLSFLVSFIISYIEFNTHKVNLTKVTSWLITSIMIGIGSIVSIIMLLKVLGSAFPIVINGPVWFISGNLIVNFSAYFDVLSISMVALVLFISFLIHFYSYFYINKSDNLPRFLSYLSLFTFSMILLLISNNLIQMFIGWEAISLCSYLLIVFWYKEKITNAAGSKAFLINRFADIGFLLGIFSTFLLFETLQISDITKLAEKEVSSYFDFLGFEMPLLTLISLFFLFAAFAKSAQIILHLWLPDAMEAPTPVSALLHAATMVTAGIFLMVRLGPIIQYSELVMEIIMLISVVTMIYAGLMASSQQDIKRIIAYSTISQLSYMFLAISINLYNGAIFHLFTHAFFKALLFLCAGSVIHALSGEQNVKNMGGLWKKMPVTYLATLVGGAALMGVPGFAGFYSKEVILHSVYLSGSKYALIAYYGALFSVFLTAFYTLRLIVLVFHGKYRGDENIKIHESNYGMLLVLVLLAFFSIVSGKALFEDFMGENSLVFWKGSIIINDVIALHDMSAKITYISLTGMFIAFLLVYSFYFKGKSMAKIFPGFNKIVANNFYLDKLYDKFIVKSFNSLGTYLTNFDNKILDYYGPNTIAGLIYRISRFFSKSQTGYVSLYAVIMVFGLFILISYISGYVFYDFIMTYKGIH